MRSIGYIVLFLGVINCDLIENPFLKSVNTFAGETLTSVLDVLSNGPIHLARNLGLTGDIPILLNNENLVNGDRILIDFRKGLGNEDIDLHVMELMLKYGYPAEEHKIETNDGYILSMHRIKRDGPPIFLMHGLLGSSDDFVVAGTDSGLAYMLADSGYDVWMGNARGNKHSRAHVEFSTHGSDFWDFSWHEIGTIDLPAMIDYTLNETGNDALKYVGHSQGSTSFFVLMSELPDYNVKVSLMVALAPVAWMSHVKAPLVRLTAPGGPILHLASRALGAREYLPDGGLARLLRTALCGSSNLADVLCSNVMFLMTGFNFDQLNATNLPVIFGHVPSGSAAKQFAHYGQEIVSGEFRQYDYGKLENFRRYGSWDPPRYNVTHISTPVSLFYSEGDWLAQPADVDTLAGQLPNVVDVYKIPLERFNHVDFLYAKDVKILINERLMKLFKLF